MQVETYQYIEDVKPRYFITDSEGGCCKGCGAALKAGPEECEYCGRPAVSGLKDGWDG